MLWGLKYVDVDDRWWVDLILQDEPPEVRQVAVGSRVFLGGFEAGRGRVLARRVSVDGGDLSDWPTDSAVALVPAPVLAAVAR